jgi:hypothetical protein
MSQKQAEDVSSSDCDSSYELEQGDEQYTSTYNTEKFTYPKNYTTENVYDRMSEEIPEEDES